MFEDALMESSNRIKTQKQVLVPVSRLNQLRSADRTHHLAITASRRAARANYGRAAGGAVAATACPASADHSTNSTGSVRATRQSDSSTE